MSARKWGFDIDGVLANFVDAFNAKLVEVTGRDLIRPEFVTNPPSWDWFGENGMGYTKKEQAATWDAIKADPQWWMGLSPLAGIGAVAEQWDELTRRGDHVYFVTARAGEPKAITEDWLRAYGGFRLPTVLMAKEKGQVAKALALDVFVEDNLPNAISVLVDSPKTRSYLIDRHYNQGNVEGIIRVNSVAEMFEREGL